MSFLMDLFDTIKPRDYSPIRFLGLNNTPVNHYCSLIPIVQPTLISTSFGQSLISLSILIIYFILYNLSSQRTGIESRLLTSLIIGNLFFTLLTFNDWFNLNYAVMLCNDYKNGVINLYQVSEAIETYQLRNLIKLHLSTLEKYSSVAIEQFSQIFINEMNKVIKTILNFKSYIGSTKLDGLLKTS